MPSSGSWPRIRHSRFLLAIAAISLFVLYLIFQQDSSGHSTVTYKHTSGSELLAQTAYVDPDPFQNFKKGDECTVSRPDIHRSYTPKCQTKEALLEAMSGGGRYGFDQPYSTLGCDMKWYTTSEICSILSYYDRIYLAGDSLIRQLVVAVHILLREDLVEGGRATWRKDNPEETTIVVDAEHSLYFPAMDCRCRVLFRKGSNCMWWEAIDTEQIWTDDPTSMKCGRDSATFSMQQMPLLKNVEDGLDSWIDSINKKIEDPQAVKNAYVFGAGSWQKYNNTETKAWADAVDEGMRRGVSSFTGSPKLWMSPPAKQVNVDPVYWNMSNNIVVQHNVFVMDKYVTNLGYDHLRVYNLTVQATSPDGTHTSLENTLVEAMMLLNWLDISRDTVH